MGLWICVVAFLLCHFITVGAEVSNQTTVIVVVGAPGQPEFGSNFLQQATLWQQACATGNCHCITVGTAEPAQTNDFEVLRHTLANETTEGPDQLCLVLLGHGTFDGN